MSTLPRALRAMVFPVALAIVAGCSGPPDRRGDSSIFAPADSSELAPPDFINTVWVVARSSAAEPGMLYAFLADSTLVMSSSHANAAFGTWRYAGGQLTLVESGRAYPVDVLSLTADSLSIVLRGPGAPVSMTLVPASRPLP